MHSKQNLPKHTHTHTKRALPYTKKVPPRFTSSPPGTVLPSILSRRRRLSSVGSSTGEPPSAHDAVSHRRQPQPALTYRCPVFFFCSPHTHCAAALLPSPPLFSSSSHKRTQPRRTRGGNCWDFLTFFQGKKHPLTPHISNPQLGPPYADTSPGDASFLGGGVVVVLLWQTPPFPARRCSHSAQSAAPPATPRYTGQNVIFCKITHDNDRLSQGGMWGGGPP